MITMDELTDKTILESDGYVLFRSEPIKDIADEAHYAVFNIEHNVVEMRTSGLIQAVDCILRSQQLLDNLPRIQDDLNGTPTPSIAVPKTPKIEIPN